MARNDSRDVIYVANTTGFATLPDGSEFFFRQGVTKIRRDHPAMKSCPRFFEPLDPTAGVVDYVKP